MKILKKIGIVLVILIAIPLVIALFIDKEYAVERGVIINKSKAEVFDYIKYLKNQDNYSVWAKKDPKMQKKYAGTDGTVGFVSKWNSKDENVGVGEQEIKKITSGSRVDYELRFKEPFEATDNAYMTTKELEPMKTQVTWGFNGKMDYPMNFMLLFMDMEEMLGNDLEEGLGNLKRIMEE